MDDITTVTKYGGPGPPHASAHSQKHENESRIETPTFTQGPKGLSENLLHIR